MRTAAGNPPLLCAFHALQMSLFPVAVITLFWKHRIGMDMSQILLLQGSFGLAMAMFEFPSGYLADRIGYRRTLVLASLLATCGWGIYCVAGSFASVLLAELVLGVAMALVSGTDNALMYESLVESGREGAFGIWNGRFRFWGQSAEGTAALAAGALFVWWVRLPFVLEVVVWATNVAVAWRLVEPRRHLPAPGSHWRQVRHMLRYAFLENRRLTAVVSLTVLLGLASFVPVWLVPLYATGAGVAAIWIGPIWAVANYVVAVASLWSERVGRRFGLLPTLALCVVLVFAGYLGMALTYAVWGFAFYYLLTFQRGLFGPVLLHEEQRLLPSTDRAGYLSLRSLVFRLSFFAAAPFIGGAIDRHGQHPVLLVLGIVFGVLAAGAWLWLRTQIRRRA